MRTALRAGKVGRALLGACMIVASMAATGTGAAPSWASPNPMHKQSTPPSTTTPVPTTTTTTMTSGPAPAPPAPAPPDNCVRGSWPQSVQGRPIAYQAGEGAYLWHDPDGGWALRITRSGTKLPFSGYLSSVEGTFIDVNPIMGSSDDIVVPGRHSVYFRFVGDAAVDGLDFDTQCARAFTVDIHMGGGEAPTSAIHLGPSLSGPASNPFRVERVRVQAPDVTLATPTTTRPAMPSAKAARGTLAS